MSQLFPDNNNRTCRNMIPERNGACSKVNSDYCGCLPEDTFRLQCSHGVTGLGTWLDWGDGNRLGEVAMARKSWTRFHRRGSCIKKTILLYAKGVYVELGYQGTPMRLNKVWPKGPLSWVIFQARYCLNTEQTECCFDHPCLVESLEGLCLVGFNFREKVIAIFFLK